MAGGLVGGSDDRRWAMVLYLVVAGGAVHAGFDVDAECLGVGAAHPVPLAADHDQVADVDRVRSVVTGCSGSDLVGADLLPVGELVGDLGQLVGQIAAGGTGRRRGDLGVTGAVGQHREGAGGSVEAALDPALPCGQSGDAVGDGLRVVAGSLCGGCGPSPGSGSVGVGLGDDGVFGGRAAWRRMAGSLWWPARIGWPSGRRPVSVSAFVLA